MQFAAIGEPRGRRDLGPMLCDGEDQAAVHAPAVEQDRARTALPVVAALLRARHSQPLAQRIEQRGSRIDLDVPLGAVDPQRDRRQTLLVAAHLTTSVLLMALRGFTAISVRLRHRERYLVERDERRRVTRPEVP